MNYEVEIFSMKLVSASLHHLLPLYHKIEKGDIDIGG
jgi:hypothetical protein